MRFNERGDDPRTPSKAHGHSKMSPIYVPCLRMHTPIPDPMDDEEEPEIKRPPVPPDQEDEIVPQRDPPVPGRGRDPPPMIV
jgi:hypothetical protein